MIPEQFKIKPGGFDEIRKGLIVKMLPVVFLSLCAGLAVTYFNSPNHDNDLLVYSLTLPLVLGAAAFGVYLGIKRQKALFESYTLTFKNDAIIREQANTPIITIAYTDVSEIAKSATGGFVIKGTGATSPIIVVAQIENYERLEQLLNTIKPISKQVSQALTDKYRIPLVITVVGLYMAVYLSTNKALVGLCGTVLIGVLGWSVFDVWRNKNIDNRTRMSMWLVVLVGISLVSVIYYKLTAGL